MGEAREMGPNIDTETVTSGVECAPRRHFRLAFGGAGCGRPVLRLVHGPGPHR